MNITVERANITRETNHDIFVDPQTSDHLSRNRFNAFHISHLYKTCSLTAPRPSRCRAAWPRLCKSLLLISTSLSQTTRPLVWEAWNCQTVSTDSLSYSFISPAPQTRNKIFTKMKPPKCDWFLKKCVGMCYLQRKGLKSLGPYCPLSSESACGDYLWI